MFSKVESSSAYQGSKRIGIFLSMPKGEVQTDSIVRHALGEGKQVFVPYIQRSETSSSDAPKSLMNMVDLRSLSDYELLSRDNWGIPTISKDTVLEREHILKSSMKASLPLDMILVPGVAFDEDLKTGHVTRLGHGKGFYDRFLRSYYEQTRGTQNGGSNLRPGSDLILYGLCLKEQNLSRNELPITSIPVEKHDCLLHGLFDGSEETIDTQ